MGTTVTVAALTVGQFAAHFAFPPNWLDVFLFVSGQNLDFDIINLL